MKLTGTACVTHRDDRLLPGGARSSPGLCRASLGLTQAGEVARPAAATGFVFSQGSSPFQPHVAAEVALVTSSIRVRGQRSAHLPFFHLSWPSWLGFLSQTPDQKEAGGVAAARVIGGRNDPFTSGTRVVSQGEAPPYEALGSPRGPRCRGAAARPGSLSAPGQEGWAVPRCLLEE